MQSKNSVRALYWAVIVTAPLALLALIKFPGIERYLPECLFLKLTGHPCPSCGLTRSVVLALHGDLAASFEMHPFGAASLVAAFFVYILALAGVILKKNYDKLLGRWLKILAIAMIILYIGVWSLRGH